MHKKQGNQTNTYHLLCILESFFLFCTIFCVNDTPFDTNHKIWNKIYLEIENTDKSLRDFLFIIFLKQISKILSKILI